MSIDQLIQAIGRSDYQTYEAFYSTLFQGYIIPLFFAFIALEVFLLRYLKKTGYRRYDTLVDIGLFLGKIVFEFLTISLVLKIHLLVWDYRIMEFRVESMGQLIVPFLIADFVYYLVHLSGHKWRIGWMTHVVHHSLRRINILSSVRQGWTNFFSLTWLVPIPFILLGIHPFWLELGLALVIAYQFWLHTELIGRLGILEYVVNTPNLHRVHHSSQPEFRDKNFGGVLMFWDHLFGTYAGNSEEKKITFGVRGFDVKSVNPLAYIIAGLKTLL